MTDLRDHENELAGVLTRLGRNTPFAEALAQESRGEIVGLDSKSRHANTTTRLAGVVFRAWGGTRWIEAASSGFDQPSLDSAADSLERSLVASASHTPPPGPSSTAVGTATSSSSKPMREMGMGQQLEYARDIFRWASAVPRVHETQVEVGWWDDDRFYLNTAGAKCFHRASRVRAGLACVALENGRTEFDYDGIGGIGGQELLADLTEERARILAQDAVDMLSAKAPPTGFQNVLLDNGTTATFAHESFGHGTEADQFVRDRSYLKPRLGEMVGPEELTMIDDGSIPGGWGSLAFDDEGHPGHKTTLVDRGRFVGALHDRDSAEALHATPTGNTRRSDFLSRAFVRMTNMYVEPRDWSFDEIVKETGDGVLLQHWTSGMEDPLGGQMQLKVLKGRRIEHGRLTDLVSSMALSGSVLNFLRDIRAIGDAKGFRIETGFCGKGHGDYLPTGDGGPHLLSRAVVGPA